MDKIRKLRLYVSENHPLEEQLLQGKEVIVYRVDRGDDYNFLEGEIVLGCFSDGRFAFLRITERTRKVHVSKLNPETLTKIRKTINNLTEGDLLAIIRFRALALVGRLIFRAD